MILFLFVHLKKIVLYYSIISLEQWTTWLEFCALSPNTIWHPLSLCVIKYRASSYLITQFFLLTISLFSEKRRKKTLRGKKCFGQDFGKIRYCRLIALSVWQHMLSVSMGFYERFLYFSSLNIVFPYVESV